MSDDDIQQVGAADYYFGSGDSDDKAKTGKPAAPAPAAAAAPAAAPSPREKLMAAVQSRLKKNLGRSPYPMVSDIINALTQFQNNIDLLAQDDKIGQNINFSTLVIDDFATVLAAVSGNALQNQHRQLISRVKTLFQEQFAKRELPPEIKMLLAQLQIPFLKISFIESDLLNQSDFSGRILFNQVVELGRTVDRQLLKHNPLYAEYFRIIKSVSRKFDRDITIFNDIIMSSNLLRQKMRGEDVAPAKAPAPAPIPAPPPPPQKTPDQIRGDKINSLLEKAQRGKKLPTRIVQFLTTTWKGVLDTTLGKYGENHAQFENACEFLERLAWISDMQLNLSDDNVIKDTFAELVIRLNRGIEAVGDNSKLQEQCNRLLLDLFYDKISR